MVELLQQRQVEEVLTVRCERCGGLRGVTRRHFYRSPAMCAECVKGNVVERTHYHNYWLKRFSREEIEQMARAIWG